MARESSPKEYGRSFLVNADRRAGSAADTGDQRRLVSGSAVRGRGAAESPPRVLLAEDNRGILQQLGSCLVERGYSVTECDDGFELLDRLGSFLIPGDETQKTIEECDLVICDADMTGVSVIDILLSVSGACNLPPVVLVGSSGHTRGLGRTADLGVVAVFDKPVDIDELLALANEIAPVVNSCHE